MKSGAHGGRRTIAAKSLSDAQSTEDVGDFCACLVKRIAPTAFAVILGSLLSATANAAVYRCEIGGKVTYSDQPCPAGAHSEVKTPPSTRPPDPKAPIPSIPSPSKSLPPDEAKPGGEGGRATRKSRTEPDPHQGDRMQCVADTYNAWHSKQSPRPAREAADAKLKEVGEQCKQRYPIPTRPTQPRATLHDDKAESLRTSIDKRDLPGIDAYLREGGNPNATFIWPATRTREELRSPAVLFAANKTCLDCVRRLVEAGASIDAKNQDGWTVTHAAVNGGYPPLLEYVLARGGSLTTSTKSGLTPVHVAAMGLSVPALKIVLARKPPLDASIGPFFGTPLIASVRSNTGGNDRLPLIKELLAAGADPNVRGPQGTTALHVAVEGYQQKPYLDVIRLLLAAKADPKIKNDAGETALALASRLGRSEAILLLSERA